MASLSSTSMTALSSTPFVIFPNEDGIRNIISNSSTLKHRTSLKEKEIDRAISDLCVRRFANLMVRVEVGANVTEAATELVLSTIHNTLNTEWQAYIPLPHPGVEALGKLWRSIMPELKNELMCSTRIETLSQENFAFILVNPK